MKRAQFRNMETIIITIVLTILFISGYAVYNKISYGNWEQKQLEFEKGRRAQLNTLISNIPELKCSTLGVQEVSCMDIFKIQAFNNLESKQLYSEVFGNVEVVLKMVDLENGVSSQIVIFNDSLEDYSSKTPVFKPILVNNPVNRTSNFGILITTFYER